MIDTLPERLADALRAAGYTYDGVAARLGVEAHAALGRNETVPGRRATTSADPLDTLIRLFLLQTEVPADVAERALPGLVDPLCSAGLLRQTIGEVAAALDCRPYATAATTTTTTDAATHAATDAEKDEAEFWVVSDLTPGLDGAPSRVASDYVLGVSPASTSLAQLTLRDPVGRALDLGTGCGVQALHLAGHAGEVVATDVNRRALWMARFNRALNGAEQVEVREGSFFEPVAGERFDLIATNPPFVISPATGEPLVYRDSGLPGDRVVEHIVRAAPDLLTDGGWCQVLGNWVITRDQAWDERLADWLDPGCDALVVQREVLDPAAYVELWLKDEGVHPATGGSVGEYRRRYDTWLSWFEREGVEAVGFGWLNLRRGGSAVGGRHDLLDWPYDVEQPVAPAVAAWGAAAGREVSDDDRLVLAPDVRQETQGAPGAADPETIVLRQQRGLRRARQVDTVEAAVVGACDGELTVGRIAAAVATLLEEDAGPLTERLRPVLTDLVREGYLLTDDA